jgi:TonB-linked SusC/RagA family outer membrane protein
MKKFWKPPFQLTEKAKKLILTMKLTVFILFLTLMQVSATVYSQATKFSFRAENKQVVEVLQQIEENSDFRFFFLREQVDVERKVTVTAREATVEQILDELFRGEPVSYEFANEALIVLTRSDNPLGSINSYITETMQQPAVSGTVTDSGGQPLPGVTVVVKGTTRGTVTNADGNYSLTNIPEDATLQFSFVGMRTQEITIGEQTTINVTMEEETIGIEEVVAIGYGSIKKSDLTGAVSQVKSKDIAAYPSINMTQALQGRTAGVQIQSNNGEPGSSYKVRIRGATSINSSSDPLYVVDGFPGGYAPPAEDIESIEILKDASATAIYGSRGANGVILITTKRGSKGEAIVELNSSYSFQTAINKLDLLNKDQFTDYITEISPTALDGQLIGPGTDWQDEIFRNGGVQNYQLSFKGGSEQLKYYISGIAYDHKGIVLNSNHKRYSVTGNFDLNISEKFCLGSNFFLSRTQHDGIRTQENGGSTGVVTAAFQMEPTLPVYDDNGDYTISFLGDPNDNPVALAEELKSQYVDDIMQANFFGEYDLLKDLKLKVVLGATTGNNRSGGYTSTSLMSGNAIGGAANLDGSKSTNLINENYLTYTKSFGEHDITAMGGYSYQSARREYWGAASTTFLSDAFLWWDLDGGSVYKGPYSGITESELASYYGRVNYKLADKYLITLNARYDGSSRFAKNNKWAFFPSGAIAWNVAEESFMDDIPEVSQLKIRASYGVTGNQAIAEYRSLARLSTVHSVQGGQIVNAVRPSTVANNNLTWESTAQTDIGFDLGLFNQRVMLVADYYYKKTTDLLFNLPLPEYSGYTTMLKNIGSLENKGFEFTLSTVNIDNKFKWTSDLNFSFNRNKVLDLPDGNDIFYRVMPAHMVGITNTNVLREGEAVGVFYGYLYDGVNQENENILPGNFDQYAGGEKYKDVDGTRDEEGNLTGEPDGEITSDDRTIMGDPNPDFIWGLTNNFEYKGFDLNIFIQGSQGNDMFSYTLMELETLRGYNNSTTRALDRWTPTNTDTDVPVASSARGYHSSSRWVYDGSYVRLKNIALGYSLPKSWINPLGLSHVKLYVSGQNLLTLTKYRGYDPEVNYNGSNISAGFDYGSYPSAKSYTFGVKVIF